MEEKLEKLELAVDEGESPSGSIGSITDWLDDAEQTFDELIGEYGKPEVWKGGKERIVKRDNKGRFVRWFKVGET